MKYIDFKDMLLRAIRSDVETADEIIRDAVWNGIGYGFLCGVMLVLAVVLAVIVF